MKNKFLYVIFLMTVVVSCGPSNEELMLQSRSLMNRGDYKAALELLNKIIEHDKKNQPALNMRGIAKLELGKAENAINDFDASIALDTNDYRAYYNRANAFYRIERYPQALEDYDAALRFQPKEVDIYINRGNVLVQLEKYEEAIYDYDFALQLDNQNYLTHFNLARAYYLMDSLHLAKKSFENSLNLYGTFAPSYYFLGMIALENDEVDSSCLLFQKATDLGYEQAREIRKIYCEQN